MIAQLRGRLLLKDLARAVVDVQGVGFDLAIPLATYERLPRLGEEVTLLTHLQVREDALVLYGFGTEAERSLFLLLVQLVSGIGPKTALGVLSGTSVDAFCTAIVQKDVKSLSRLPGIGKRTAERLVVELQGKLDDLAPAIALGAKTSSADPAAAALGRAAEDAIAGLTALGHRADLARQVVRQVLDEHLPGTDASAQSLIRRSLAKMAR